MYRYSDFFYGVLLVFLLFLLFLSHDSYFYRFREKAFEAIGFSTIIPDKVCVKAYIFMKENGNWSEKIDILRQSLLLK